LLENGVAKIPYALGVPIPYVVANIARKEKGIGIQLDKPIKLLHVLGSHREPAFGDLLPEVFGARRWSAQVDTL
jgi:hypothetical protein